MTHRVGDGLPSTLTASRIKGVLKLAKSHERALTEALDANASQAWTETDPSGNLYERLRALLTTIEGRNAYEEARSVFEKGKIKLSGRADFRGRLLKSCWSEAPGQREVEEYGSSPLRDLMERLARGNAWSHLADVVWASSLNLDDAEYFLSAIDSYPEIRPYLEEVQAGIFRIEEHEDAPIRESDAEVAELTSLVRQVAENIDVDRLNEQELRALSRDVLRLADIARDRDTRDRDISLQKEQVEDWETQRSDAISGATEAAEALAVLKAQIDRGAMDQEGVGTVLDLADQLLSADTRYRETHERLNRASSDEDFVSVGSLADLLKSLRVERDEVRTAINNALADPPSDGPSPPVPPTEEPADSLEFKKIEHEATPDEPQQSDGKPAPSTVADRPEPTTEERPALVGPDETDEPPTEATVETARPDDDEDAPAQRIQDAIATAIERSHLGLAYHLALAAPGASPSAGTVKLIACNYVTDDRTPISAELSHLAGALLDEVGTAAEEGTDPPHRHDNVILTTCAALTPALAAPGGPVAQLLSRLEPLLGDMSSLRALARTAAEVSMKGIHIPTALLREDDSLDNWRVKESALRIETTAWVTNERRSTIRFHAATQVWRRMLEEWDRGERVSLGRMFSLLDRSADEINTESIAQISEYWRAHGEREIDRIDREHRSRASTNKIEGPARLALRGKMDQALSFSDRWLSLIRDRPDQRPTFYMEQAELLRNTVNANADQALAEIDAVATPVARIAAEQLRRYTALFQVQDCVASAGRLGLIELLNGDILADPNIVCDDTGQPTCHPLDPDVLLSLVKQEVLDFGRAAVERAQRGDIPSAELTIDFAERTGRISENDADHSRMAIDQQRAQIQQQLEDKIRETRARLDAAYSEGALTVETYEEQSGRIPSIDFSQTKTYLRFLTTLHEIDSEIEDAKAGRRDAMRRSLDTLDSLTSEEKGRIDSAIDVGLFQIAEDFIERIERGEGLPASETASERPFDQFFPSFVDKYSACGEEGEDGLNNARHVIEKRVAADFIDASTLSEDASRDGVRILDSWIALREGQNSHASLRTLMSKLGFESVEVKGRNEKTAGGEKIFLLQAAAIADRAVCRLPDFGSRANGRYRLFAVRGRTTEEAVIREARERSAAGNPPNIVLFLGVLDVNSRRSLARAFGSGDYHPTIVLDEALVTFLAAWRGNRLDAFFDCASAFAFSQPFDPDATELPPEMFFGRTAERKKILAMSGDMTHLVYGGRRLGKTTLLADIAREFRAKRNDGPKELVSLINLKGSGIGENRPTEDLWRLFAAPLIENGILQPRTVRPDSIEMGVKQWLDNEAGRRILLLVDEADAFLDAERRPEQAYRVLEKIKGLMEQTKRAFKVVFAGLHNVQRAARDPNTPFAHLGEAIRIGPMLPGTDREEIQNLIRSPLEALGYRFASNVSVIRIAAETNYYPALAQQFCKELLKTLREEADARVGTGPPYPIHPDMVDRVFSGRETRDRNRFLFSWTVQLDPRYEFLTYLIAQKSFDNEDARPQAMPIADIREAALDEWPQGFSLDSSYWMFEVLLEEMIGLGILREAPDKKYAIRTRNLRMLLGNDDEIDRRFADAKSKMAPAIFDPAQFRDTLSDQTPSSLSADQENRLLSGRYAVGLVFGTRLAALERVRESLDLAIERRDEPVVIEEVVPDGLHRALRRASLTRRAGIQIIFVDMCGAWDLTAVEHALAFVGEHEGQDRIIRPVFLCGPQEAWELLKMPLAKQGRVECREIWLGPCGRDFIRTWLRERESPAYVSMENPDKPVDLPWPATVGMAAQDTRLASVDEAASATLDADNDKHYLSDILISTNATEALRLMSTFPDESMTADDLSDLSQGENDSMSPEEVTEFFSWADRLGIVRRDGHGYRLDSTYAAGLGRIF